MLIIVAGTVTVQSLVIPTVTQLAPPSQGLAGAGGAADAAVEVQGSKIEALLSLLQQTPLGEKVVVFSQFTGLLDICARAIASKGSVGTSVALEGRMSAGQREKSLRSFETESGPRVMLASPRACGVGLTLTSANHIVLMEPFWSGHPPLINSACFACFVCWLAVIIIMSRLDRIGTPLSKIRPLTGCIAWGRPSQ